MTFELRYIMNHLFFKGIKYIKILASYSIKNSSNIKYIYERRWKLIQLTIGHEKPFYFSESFIRRLP